MTDTTSNDVSKVGPKKRIFVWLLVVSVLLLGTFVGGRALLINTEVADFEMAFEEQRFDDARQAIENLQDLDPENPLIDKGLSDIDKAEKQIAIAGLEVEYLSALEGDDLDEARLVLDRIFEVDQNAGVKFEAYDRQLGVLIASKRSYGLGISDFNNGDISGSIILLSRVSPDDKLRFADAQSKLAQASEIYARELSASIKGLVAKEFFISAFLELEEAKEFLGRNSKSIDEIASWFEERFERAKQNALKNQMAVRKDSFTGQVSYYYRPTYVTCCGGSLQAADRFRLVIIGDANPRLRFNVMLYQDDWVFADRIEANIDGQFWTIATDSYFGDTIERDNAYGSIWEYTYREPSSEDLRYLILARESKQTLVRFQGDQNRGDFVVSSRMKDGIEQVLLAYLALGGRLNL